MSYNFREYFIKYYKQAGQIQLDFLDSIDFLPYLENQKKLSEVMHDIEDKYDYGSFLSKIPAELQGCVFNLMDEYEFGLYLQDRYPNWEIVEYTDTWYEVRKKSNGVNS